MSEPEGDLERSRSESRIRFVEAVREILTSKGIWIKGVTISQVRRPGGGRAQGASPKKVGDNLDQPQINCLLFREVAELRQKSSVCSSSTEAKEIFDPPTHPYLSKWGSKRDRATSQSECA